MTIEHTMTINTLYELLKLELKSEDGNAKIAEKDISKIFSKARDIIRRSDGAKIVSKLQTLDLSEHEEKYKSVGFLRSTILFTEMVQYAANDHYGLESWHHYKEDDPSCNDGKSKCEVGDNFASLAKCQAFALRELVAFCNVWKFPLYDALFEGGDCGMESYAAHHHLQEWHDMKWNDLVNGAQENHTDKDTAEVNKTLVLVLENYDLVEADKKEYLEYLGEVWGSLGPNIIKGDMSPYGPLIGLIEKGEYLDKHQSEWKDIVRDARVEDATTKMIKYILSK